ncbi:hypothetical protein BJ741DRAFT_615006 [Chytriomyces cf. hyalinus JEL632]|nr:hypothetical protein BJ741DRAFT_615006 [Chytriomyces cf. hyalinus JEL632]
MAAAMVYSGGTWARLLTNATVHPIFYGPVKRVPEILSFYASVGNTPWFEVMAQYNITSMQLGTPVYINATQPSIDNLKDLQPLLKSLIASGDIQPNENTYYPVHIAPGINVTNQVGKGCVNWCGFHTAHWISGWSKTVNWFPLVYGVVMDQSGGCGGCDVFGISAHELAESLTDPVPYGGWASSTATGNLEVADV